MVYRGKPSASCERCRSRRLKVRSPTVQCQLKGKYTLKQQPESDACSSAIKAIRPVHNAYVLKLNVLDIVIP
jgi:hypothetical protein